MKGVRVLLVAAGLVAGCAKSEEKLYVVSGTVTFNGKPVPMGLVFFDPDTSKGNSGLQGFANIQGGKFTTVKGQGVRGGAYSIRVLGYDGKSGNDLPMGHPLFNEYEVKKELPQADSELNLDIPAKRR
jgi:hypothetical protein